MTFTKPVHLLHAPLLLTDHLAFLSSIRPAVDSTSLQSVIAAHDVCWAKEHDRTKEVMDAELMALVRNNAHPIFFDSPDCFGLTRARRRKPETLIAMMKVNNKPLEFWSN